MPKAKAEKKEQEVTELGGYVLVNQEKLDRVINGIAGTDYKGLGRDASEEAILAEYDRFGGLILTEDGEKVATGSFYDFKKGAVRSKVEVRIATAPNKSGAPVVVTEEVTDNEDKPRKGRSKKQMEADGE